MQPTVYYLGVLALVAIAASVDIKQCTGSAKKVSGEDVSISKCSSPPCSLKRRTTITVEYQITPDRDVKSLTNTVFARILGLPLPFIGVDSTDACPQIYTVDGEPNGCPLQAGQKYVYKNSFKILPLYPLLNVEVHWGLTSDNKDIFCFEVPAKIVN